MVKLTGLSRANVRAIEECWPGSVERGEIKLGKTTAEFCNTAEYWAREVDWMIGSLRGRGHPRASLHRGTAQAARPDLDETRADRARVRPYPANGR